MSNWYRRSFVGLTAAWLDRLGAQAHEFEDLAAKFAVFGLHSPGYAGLAPKLDSLRGSDLGEIPLTGLTTVIAVSPDGNSLAWTPEESQSYPQGKQAGNSTELKTLYWAEAGAATTAIQHEYFTAWLAISGTDKKRIAMIARKPEERFFRLVILDGKTGHTHADLTEAIQPIEMRGLAGLAVSASGERVMVVRDRSFSVIETATGHVTGFAGHAPSLSPSGDRVAYVDANGRPCSLTTKSNAVAVVAKWDGIDGFGAWSPDAKFLFATEPGLTERG